MKIGYYVHHHGRGHATRAAVIGVAAQRRGHHVTFLGSGPLPDGECVTLPRDDVEPLFRDSSAGGRLHWAPLGGGYRDRMTRLADWVAQAAPDVVVTDVSAEVTILARTLGVPVVMIAQPGERTDAPHKLAFDVATRIVAPWPEGMALAPHLHTVAGKTTYVGGISRLDGTRTTEQAGRTQPTVGLLVGGPGWDDPQFERALQTARPGVRWLRPSGGDVVTMLASVDLVVTHAGQNAIADVAACGTPALVVPQHRPFREQEQMAEALAAAGLATTVRLGASADEVADRLDAALAGDRTTAARAWTRWRVSEAATRAVAAIEVAAR